MLKFVNIKNHLINIQTIRRLFINEEKDTIYLFLADEKMQVEPYEEFYTCTSGLILSTLETPSNLIEYFIEFKGEKIIFDKETNLNNLYNSIIDFFNNDEKLLILQGEK
jgi:hypothetical protein